MVEKLLLIRAKTAKMKRISRMMRPKKLKIHLSRKTE